jgi:hypothetical protein
VKRAPGLFYLLPLHHRTLKEVVRVQHPEQRPLPFRYVVTVISSIADALEAAARVGVVHLDIQEENVMVDDPESMAFDAEQRAAAPPDTADELVVDFSKCRRRYERPPAAVVVGWTAAKAFDADAAWVVHVPVVDGNLTLPDRSQPWGNAYLASPELQVEWRRAAHELERAKVGVCQAYQAKTSAANRTFN